MKGRELTYGKKYLIFRSENCDKDEELPFDDLADAVDIKNKLKFEALHHTYIKLIWRYFDRIFQKYEKEIAVNIT